MEGLLRTCISQMETVMGQGDVLTRLCALGAEAMSVGRRGLVIVEEHSSRFCCALED